MKLLIVDDDAVIADFVRQALKEDGYAVDIARDRAEGRMLAMVYDYDGLVLDLVLPDGTGIELLRELRADPELKNATVVVLTTSNDERDKVDAYDLNVAGYLLKPVTFSNFCEVMAALNRYWALVELP